MEHRESGVTRQATESSMNRRNFIRIAGAGTAASAVAGVFMLASTDEAKNLPVNQPITDSGNLDGTDALGDNMLHVDGVKFGEFTGDSHFVVLFQKGEEKSCAPHMNISTRNPQASDTRLSIGEFGISQWTTISEGETEHKEGISGYPSHSELCKELLEFIRKNDCVDIAEQYLITPGEPIDHADDSFPDPNAPQKYESLDAFFESRDAIPSERLSLEDLNKIFILKVAIQIGGYETLEDLKKELSE
ncbi:hypothetical protein HOD71_01310 [Candidatus Peribacteria bacterium]|jgi:hypothetical protein|nr:hypothetical protein [Candidatus Peribacteria bacterium]